MGDSGILSSFCEHCHVYDAGCVLHLRSWLVVTASEVAGALITTTFLFQDLVANGALVSICNKYGEMPVDKAKAPLRELLRGPSPTPQLVFLSCPHLSSISQLRPRLFVFLSQSGQRRWARISTVYHTRTRSGRGPPALGPVSQL